MRARVVGSKDLACLDLVLSHLYIHSLGTVVIYYYKVHVCILPTVSRGYKAEPLGHFRWWVVDEQGDVHAGVGKKGDMYRSF